MKKEDVVRVLEEMAVLLELSDANRFEIIAHQNGARSLASWDGDLESAVREGALREIQGIGKGLASVITELVKSGRSSEHERLRGGFPEGVPDLVRVPGLGPKKIKALVTELGIDGLDALERAARDGRIRELAGFGQTSERRILERLERMKERERGARAAPAAQPSKETADRKWADRAATTAARVGGKAGAKGGAKTRRRGGGRALIGTSGYSYAEWKGSFFPQELPQSKFLEFYSRALDTVEINNTFYRFPTSKVIEQWREETPEGFTFAVKANRRITHLSRLANVSDTTHSFVERCRELGTRLGPILFQLPPQFKRNDERLAEFLASLPEGERYAMEFRHESWFDESVFERLESAGVALVISEDDSETDGDAGESATAPRRVTADFAYIRLRRSKYTNRQLDAWRKWIETQRKEGRDVFAYLKHDESGTSPEPIIRRLQAAASAKKAKKRRGAG